jgi:hypothetical protein
MKEIYKTITPYLIIGILIVIASFIMKCEREPQPKKPQDETTVLISQITNKVENGLTTISRKDAIIDSLIRLKPKYIKGKDRVRDSLIYISDSICVNNLIALNNECQKIDSVNNAIISEQEIQMIKYSEVVGLMQERNSMQEKRHVKDSIGINTLTKKLTRTRKIAVIGIGAAFIGGLIIK